ncbi:MAG: hypothetical protein J6J36_02795 [Clostridia bacterium]|nr:hypothetical protein [Clostridia bacterium]
MSKKIKGKIVDINNTNIIAELDSALSGDFREYEVCVQKKTKKRGLDANALSWTLIDRIAKSVKSSRDEIYDLMLERYGVATYLIVKPGEAQRILDLLEHGKILGDVTINGKIGTQLQIFIGSSNYNREEFSHYLSRYNF